MLLLIVASAFLAASVYVATEVVTAPERERRSLVRRAAGYGVPGYLVSVRARRRRDQVQAELPDALDLLAVSVEAGLGFDAAIAKLTEHMEGALIDELGLTLGEIRVGESRQDALKKLAAR